MVNDVVVHEQKNAIESITQGGGFYSSLKTNTRQEKMNFLRAVNNSTPLLDEAGKTLKIVDVVLQSVEIANEQTGLIEDAVRITLVNEEGAAYHATSKGIAQALKQAMGVFGTPDTWSEPLEVTPVEEKGRNGFRYLTLKF